MTEHYIVKVSVNNGQARITIPKEIAEYMGLLMENGEQGKRTHVIIRSRGVMGFEVTPAKVVENGVIEEVKI